MIVNFIGLLANQNIDKIIETVNIWGTVFLVILSAFFLYFLRGRMRLSYGITEFLFGIIVSVRTFYPDFDLKNLKSIIIFQIVAGLYIMIRGLDNIGKGLKGTFLEPYWCIYSGETFETNKSNKLINRTENTSVKN